MHTDPQQIDMNPQEVRKILVCQLRQIGDVLLATPSVTLLKKRFPNAEIHLLTEKKTLPVVEGNPDIAKIHAVDRKAHKNIAKQLQFYLSVAKEQFDIIVDFQQLPRIRWVVALSRLFRSASGRQIRLSYTAPWYNRWMYTHQCDMHDGYAAMAKASVLRPLGIKWNYEPPILHLSDTELAEADAILADHGITGDDVLITVDPSHRRDTRRWPATYFGETIRLAVQQDPRLKFVIFYGPGEERDAQKVAEHAQTDACVVTKNMLSIRQMAAVIDRADLHFGNCSAPRHIAVGVNTPTLAVLGSTSPAWTFPSDEHEDIVKGLDCQPCNENTCPNGLMRCLTEFTPEEVLPQLMQRIRRYAGEA